jgi:hypothetical protein
MHCRRGSFTAVVLVAVSLVGHQSCWAQTPQETRAASTLFSNFETVAYTQSNFLSSFAGYEETRGTDSATNLALPFVELMDGLKALGPKVPGDLERSYGGFLVGAKDFGGEYGLGPGPDGLGMINSSKCYIGLLESGALLPNLEQDFRRATYESIAGKQVWTWSVPQYEGSEKSTQFYASQIGDSYFVMTNNRADFLYATNALTPTAPELSSVVVNGWKTFSTYSYWAHREIRRSVQGSSAAVGTTTLTPDVYALTFYADLNKRQGFIRVLSSDMSKKTIPNVLPVSEQGLLHAQGEGIWQAAIHLSKDQAAHSALFQVFYCLGFAVVI